MNREDIIRMAEKAGAIHIHGNPKEFALAGNKEIERFAAIVASAEREACAMECLKKANAWTRLGAWGSNNEFHECAEAIRARGDKHD